MCKNVLLAFETFHCTKKMRGMQDIMGLELDKIGASIASTGLICIKTSTELN